MIDTATAAGLDPATLSDLLRVAGSPGFDRLHEQIRRTGGCTAPIRLSGGTKLIDPGTGTLLHSYDTSTEPGGVLRVACGNRRASRCPACAWTYAGDTYHLIRAGLIGDPAKGTPETIRDHPRVFATLTAPSFGPVHNRPGTRPCRCGIRHPEDAEELGTPLNPDTYDYAGAVLWNNHASELWRYFTIYLRREIAARAGITQVELKEECRVSFGKVAEYQKRGAVHFHAVVRLDGPGGPHTSPPPWASVSLLDDAIRAAARRVAVNLPAAGDFPARTLAWGDQLDVQPIGGLGHEELTEQAVASYVAKYATKAAESTGAIDTAVHCRRCGGTGVSDRYDRPGSVLSRCAGCHGTGTREDLARLSVPDHVRRLMAACIALQASYPTRRLAAWAHMLGFRGHFSTKSRSYSTTLGALRQVRADYRAAQQRTSLGLPNPDDHPEATLLVVAHWAYAGNGHTPGESWLAANVRRDLQHNREHAREYRAQLEADDTGGWDD
ncbi:replication initiation protein [Streptomyces sp. PCS3-D2]|uniref:replication initiator n=1 Tax=Streptomyces sp. PCS3-D2 TaxID=1460244 RepID=UPI00044B7332|nr:replication initiator [Streptomyces sp. PCS3-D2]WKV73047.1 replication initiation protein [Streptomyces sp. PCS3-D2]